MSKRTRLDTYNGLPTKTNNCADIDVYKPLPRVQMDIGSSDRGKLRGPRELTIPGTRKEYISSFMNRFRKLLQEMLTETPIIVCRSRVKIAKIKRRRSTHGFGENEGLYRRSTSIPQKPFFSVW